MKLIFGIKVAIIGIGVVFFALILLVIFINLMGCLVTLYEKRKSAAKSRDVLPKSATILGEPVNMVKYRDETDEDEITVAISAALAAHSRD